MVIGDEIRSRKAFFEAMEGPAGTPPFRAPSRLRFLRPPRLLPGLRSSGRLHVDCLFGGRMEGGLLLPNWRERLICPLSS